MKIISWNIRGLQSFEKKREVRNLVQEKNPFILCIQETKLSVFDSIVCKSMWGGENVDFSFQSSVGASGGLVTMWDVSKVTVWSTMSFDPVLVISGRFLKTDHGFVVFNVYAPCDFSRHQVLWNNLSTRLGSLSDQNVCVSGDFNAVRCLEERRGTSGVFNTAWSDTFNNFIEDSTLLDLPLRGRMFTWFRGDGRSMSRIDRFLLSENWCLQWSNCSQVAMSRGLSDHCPLVLASNDENWGPQPLRMLKCWETLPGYNNFVRNRWQSFQLEGWGGYILKEKLKLLKLALKEWHQTHLQNLPSRISLLKEEIAMLDLKGESNALSGDDIPIFMVCPKICSLYLEFILVFHGNNLESNGYVKGMQIQSSFMESCQTDAGGTRFHSFL